MDLRELVIEMKLLERCLTLYEEKYGILSEDFYAALMAGKLARYDEFDETRGDGSDVAASRACVCQTNHEATGAAVATAEWLSLAQRGEHALQERVANPDVLPSGNGRKGQFKLLHGD